MSMIWDPEQMLFLAIIAIVIGFFIAGEMFETKRTPRPLPRRAEEAPTPASALAPVIAAAAALHAVPNAARPAWREHRLAPEAVRRVALD